MSSKQPGWLPVVGGPCDGQEMYGVDHLAAGRKVRMVKLYQDGMLPRIGALISKTVGHYVLGLNRDRIEWVRG